MSTISPPARVGPLRVGRALAPDVRGGGVGSALIAQVRTAATDAGAHKVYWLTQSGNATARRLYDSLATDTGFVHYQMEL